MIPIIHIEKEADIPTGPGITYLIGKNGIFRRSENTYYSAIVPIKEIGQLAEVKSNAKLFVQKLPYEILKKVEAFFREVYAEFHSEAIVLLYVNGGSFKWHLEIPKQKVRGLHVSYEPLSVTPPDGYELFGTIHSHAGVGAFHSGTDDNDEYHMDGLHITIGNVDLPSCSYAARWMLSGVAHPTTLQEVVVLPDPMSVDAGWISKIETEECSRDISLFDAANTGHSSVAEPANGRVYGFWGNPKKYELLGQPGDAAQPCGEDDLLEFPDFYGQDILPEKLDVYHIYMQRCHEMFPELVEGACQ
jgi:hypothetical protein